MFPVSIGIFISQSGVHPDDLDLHLQTPYSTATSDSCKHHFFPTLIRLYKGCTISFINQSNFSDI